MKEDKIRPGHCNICKNLPPTPYHECKHDGRIYCSTCITTHELHEKFVLVKYTMKKHTGLFKEEDTFETLSEAVEFVNGKKCVKSRYFVVDGLGNEIEEIKGDEK